MNGIAGALLLVLVAADPASAFMDRLKELPEKVTPDVFAQFLHPDKGVAVDVAAEGAAEPRWVQVSRANLKTTFKEAIFPLFEQGLFKSSRHCVQKGRLHHCTLVTPASLPRVAELEAKDGKLYLVRIFWVLETTGDDDDDDDLPM